LTAAFIPYMRANLRSKQRDVGSADAVVAVSAQVASYLRERSPDVAATRIEVIPNGVDIARIRSLVAAAARPMNEPYAVFIGKLARNKGVSALIDVVERARLRIPLVVIGDGPERPMLLEAASRSGVDIRVLQWMERDDVFRWLGHAEFLIFPSNWPEPLSRVLLEASALSRPIAAMNTGGTADVVVDEVTGLLSASAVELADDVARLAADAELRARLGGAAGRRAEERFDVPVVIGRMEALYADVIERARARRERGVA
jgi:glycosyltransferase involved in cell wall biosynthesis